MSSRPLNQIESVFAAIAKGILGDSYVPEVPARMAETMDSLGSDIDKKQILNAVKLMDSKPGALLLTGRAVPVSWLTPDESEALIQRWRESRLGSQRKLAGILVSLALSTAYGYPHKMWETIGYPGPLGPAPVKEPKRLHPLEITSDESIACDVVIVGSGAGGGCVAAGLAGAGLDVVVLEKGPYKSESDFNHLEPQASREMYLNGMTLATSDLGVRIIAGSTLGGGTTVNFATSFKTPDFVLEEWARVSGVDAFVSGEFEESLDEVSKRLNVNTDSSAAGRRDEVMEEGLKALGWHVDNLPRAVRNCSQDEGCGYCGFGCRIGAKQSAMRTYLEDAERDGARIVVGADVRKVNIEDGRAVGVSALVDGHRFEVQSRAVISAAGSIESPALLLRSGLAGKVGHYLHLHPGMGAVGIFDEDVRMWEGTTQARYSNEFRHWDGGYGPIFETIPLHPGAVAAGLPWISAEQHQRLFEKFGKMSFCAALSRDQSEGRVKIRRDGSPKVQYKINAADERRIAEGVVASAKVLEAAGAKEIFSLQREKPTYRPGGDAHERWAERTREIGWGQGQVTYGSWHQMSSCRMGTNPSTSVVGPEHETHEVKNLFVVDGSNFPTASGVNPMLSIYGFANRAAKKIAARLG
jgi:choline dehydrogenase-like flavoprotein